MQALRTRITSQRHFAWLMWLALLLPVAQVAASWHVLSHTAEAVGDSADQKGAPHQAHCDLCVSAAAISGGALPGQAPAIFHPSLPDELPGSTIVASRVATTAKAYLSRAPPIALI